MLVGMIIVDLVVLAAIVLGVLPPSVSVILLFVFAFMTFNVVEKGRPD